jgi:adenine-specific DNA-methyltransferase
MSSVESSETRKQEVCCTTCSKEFRSKASLKKHEERKVPCTPLVIKVEEFRDKSKQFNKFLSKEERLEKGIFFTPKKARDELFRVLRTHHIHPKKILEPSYGSGEFLLDTLHLYPDAIVHGVEKDVALYESVLPATPANKPKESPSLYCSDFLSWSSPDEFDLIVGNPPYFLLKDVSKKQYQACMSGRPNIYIAFLYKCLKEHLADNGFLAFILPTSLYNCSYYQPMRDYMKTHTTILHLETLNKPGFYETGQETMLLLLQKKAGSGEYWFQAGNGLAYLSPFTKELQALCKETTTLQKLGLGAKTGTIVWNQIKEQLSEKEGTLLIYSSNIQPTGLTFGSLGGDKKQYVKESNKPKESGPVVLVERGYGNTLRFNSALCTEKSFYAENHVNVVYAKKPEDACHLERVAVSFKDPRTKQFLEWFCGNGMVSATELETLLPIF